MVTKILQEIKGKNNGLTNAWLSSSLEISPEEQIAFLQKLAADQLPVSLKAQEMTKKYYVYRRFCRWMEALC